MRISNAGLELIKESEGLRLKAYRDTGGVWTIGYGHTMNVYPGMQISADQAFAFLLEDIWFAEEGIHELVKVELNQNQFDALVDFEYNLGKHHLEESTLLRRLNAGNYKAAAEEFGRWVYDAGKVQPGLVARRQKEKELFLSEEV